MRKAVRIALVGPNEEKKSYHLACEVDLGL